MALMCPRCGTDVPSQVLYCPYCSLPKPKRGFAAAEEPRPETIPEQTKPAVELKSKTSTTTSKSNTSTTSSKSNTSTTSSKSKTSTTASTQRQPGVPGKEPRKLRASVLSVAALVALFSIGGYIFVVPMVYSEQAEPKTVLAALEKLRKTLSNEPGVTIDARLSRELEKARRVKNLVAYQGWTIRPVKGSKTKVVLAFSYQEVGNIQQNAEWLADLTKGTFTPQTELAVAVSIKESTN